MTTESIDRAVGARKDIERKLVARALKDDAFRQRLLSDPKDALAEEIGQSLPSDIDVKVMEESTTSIYVVLPSKQSQSRELSDEELQPVAGGVIMTGHTDIIICCS
ncbi:MAG: NHLP leader peptide family RiPP precursor [Janthinobacterium lividum]